MSETAWDTYRVHITSAIDRLEARFDEQERRLSALETAISRNTATLSSDLASYREIMDMKFQAVEQATLKAEQAMTKRLDSMNEIRDAMKDQASTFVTKSVFEARFDLLMQSHLSQQKFMWMIAGACVIIPLAISVVLKFVT